MMLLCKRTIILIIKTIKMKKILMTLVLGLLISVSTMAQSKDEQKAIKAANKNIERVEKTIKLTDAERETYFELKKSFAMTHNSLKPLKESDPAKYKAGVKENGADFSKKLTKAFGEERAAEIKKAGKKPKKKK